MASQLNGRAGTFKFEVPRDRGSNLTQSSAKRTKKKNLSFNFDYCVEQLLLIT